VCLEPPILTVIADIPRPLRRYRFSLLTRIITLKDGDDTNLWSARDALVLKALALVLEKHLPVSSRCTHIKAHGGAKFAVRDVRGNLPHNRFVLGTDVVSPLLGLNI
jgi:RNA-directed DNA polymerase